MKNKIYILYISLIALFISCHNAPAPISYSDRTVVVYMIADNSLSEDAYNNINKMESSLPNNNLNLIVYFDPADDTPKLLKIQKDDTKDIKSIVLKDYREQNSASPEKMYDILSDIKNRYPSEELGLILWSHSTAWLPSKSQIKTRSFGEDNGTVMDITDLPKAIPNGFEYIIFDSCLMGSVETAYELQNKTNYILASPTETLSEGLPYSKITPILFEKNDTENRLKHIGKTFFNYYNSKKDEAYKTATISLIKTKELNKLAELTKKLLKNNPLTKWNYNYDKIQKLDSSLEVPTKLFDFYDFLQKNYKSNLIEDIENQISKTIIYKNHTEYFIKGHSNGNYKIEQFCGLSCYVPQKKLTFINNFYHKLEWTKDSGFEYLLD